MIKFQDEEDKKESNNTARLHTISHWDMLNADYSDEEWLVDHLIPEQGLVALTGEPGNYKTWLALELAKAVAQGNPFLGHFPTMEGGVVIVNKEEHLRHLQKRCKLINAESNLPIEYVTTEGFMIDKGQHTIALRKLVEEEGVKLVILDALIRMHSKNENEASAMAEVMDMMRMVTAGGAAVLFTHHHRKRQAFSPNRLSQSMRGSSDINAAIDSHIGVQAKDDEDHIIVRQSKLRQGEKLEPFKINISKDRDADDKVTGIRLSHEGEYDDTPERDKKAQGAVLELLKDEGVKMVKSEIVERLQEDCGRNATERAVKQLEADGRIKRVPSDELPMGAPNNAHYYHLAE